MSDRTRQAYVVANTAFEKFLCSFGYSGSEPATPQQVLEFAASLSLAGKAAATASTYIAGVAFSQKLRFGSDPTQNSAVKQVLRGLRRDRPQSDDRSPLTADALKQILAFLPMLVQSNYEVKLYTAAFSLCYAGFLRLAEFTSLSRSDARPPLTRKDVTILSDKSALTLSIRRSKSNQSGSPQVVTLRAAPGAGPLCPVEAMRKYLSVRPRALSLFCHYDGAPLTRHQFQRLLQRAATRLRLKGRVSSHSLRIGAASSAAARGLSDLEIMRLGRWSSNAFRRYVRTLP